MYLSIQLPPELMSIGKTLIQQVQQLDEKQEYTYSEQHYVPSILRHSMVGLIDQVELPRIHLCPNTTCCVISKPVFDQLVSKNDQLKLVSCDHQVNSRPVLGQVSLTVSLLANHGLLKMKPIDFLVVEPTNTESKVQVILGQPFFERGVKLNAQSMNVSFANEMVESVSQPISQQTAEFNGQQGQSTNK